MRKFFVHAVPRICCTAGCTQKPKTICENVTSRTNSPPPNNNREPSVSTSAIKLAISDITALAIRKTKVAAFILERSDAHFACGDVFLPTFLRNCYLLSGKYTNPKIKAESVKTNLVLLSSYRKNWWKPQTYASNRKAYFDKCTTKFAGVSNVAIPLKKKEARRD